MVALHICASDSKFLLPSRCDAERCMSKATLNRVTQTVAGRAEETKLPLKPFTVHDLRHTGSAILNELGFNSDWFEKCLPHEDGRSSRGVYNKAEYAEPPHAAGMGEDDRYLGGGKVPDADADAAEHEGGDDGGADLTGYDDGVESQRRNEISPACAALPRVYQVSRVRRRRCARMPGRERIEGGRQPWAHSGKQHSAR